MPPTANSWSWRAIRNVFLKLTPLNVSPADWGKATPQTFFRTLIDRYGADRIAWGSNFPATDDTLAGILGKAQSALSHASSEQRGWIFGRTAQRLYPSFEGSRPIHVQSSTSIRTSSPTTTERYPLAPLGGHQSDWSRTRPVTTEQMIAAMDKAGVAKAAIVQASTCYGHDNSYVADAVAAHPDRFTGVFSVDVLAADAPRRCAIGSAAASPACGCSPSAAPCRTRRPGSTIPRPIRPGNARERARRLDLPADVAQGVSADDQDGGALSEGAASSSITWRGRCWRTDRLTPRPRACSSSPAIPTVYLKLTPRSFIESRKGKATPGDVLSQLVSKFGASRLAWGSNYPSSEGSLPELWSLATEALADAAAERPGMDFRARPRRRFIRLSAK